jgi:hypothetical protein
MPLPLARAVVAALQPSGTVLEPVGDHSFVLALQEHGCDVQSCEIEDFFTRTEPADEIVTKAPWSSFSRVLAHALQLARRRAAFVCSLNHLWTEHRMRLVREQAFGYERLILFDTPSEWGGFQVGLAVLVRGYNGPCAIELLKAPGSPEGRRRGDLPGRGGGAGDGRRGPPGRF